MGISVPNILPYCAVGPATILMGTSPKYPLLTGKISVCRIIFLSPIVVRKVQQFGACPDEAQLKGNDINQYQFRVELPREQHQEDEGSRS